jgi:hypothetical protein
MACATALLEEGGGGAGDKPPEPIRGGGDAGQCADGAEADGDKHDQRGRVSTHDTGPFMLVAMPADAVRIFMIIPIPPHQVTGRSAGRSKRTVSSNGTEG